MAIHDRFVELDGLRFHYRETGNAALPAVVLLHSLGSGAADWDDVALALADRRRVLAFESRGSYGSARTEEYTFAAMRDDLRAFADQVGLDRFDLVGHSMGGTVAYLFAEEWPWRVTRLVLEDTPPPRGALPPRGDGELPPDSPFDVRMVRSIAAEVRAPDPAWWDRLPSITARTLLIAGGPTSYIPQEWIAEAARRIPDATLLEIPGGHSIHRTRPTEFIEAVREFLA